MGRSSISAKWVDALFGRFALIWPTAWADAVDRVDVAAFKGEWQSGLEGLSGEQVGRAIEHCRKQCVWPPSIAEFRRAATGGATGEQAAFAARVRESDAALRALPKETWAETRAKGKAQLEALKAALRGRGREVEVEGEGGREVDAKGAGEAGCAELVSAEAAAEGPGVQG